MGYFAAITVREAKRLSALCESYENQLTGLPKGSLRVKERNGKQYVYLAYRCDGKVISDYIGADKTAVAELQARLERRKGIEALLKSIKKELILMNKVLEAEK